jgi:hypothetical protein
LIDQKTYFLKGVGMPSERNLKRKEGERKFKYQNVNVESQRIWGMKFFVIRAVTGPQELLQRARNVCGNNTSQALSSNFAKNSYTFNKSHTHSTERAKI